MIEREIDISGVDYIGLYGAHNKNIDILRSKFPNIKIVDRGSLVKVYGEIEQLNKFGDAFQNIINYYVKHNFLTEEIVVSLIDKEEIHTIPNVQGVILHGNNGKPIRAKTKNQQVLVDKVNELDLVFAIGPAGSGKTYTAIALAVAALKERRVKKIILSRPAVEAGESLGFLPGDMKEKIDPYLRPLYDALLDMIPARRLEDFIADGVVEIAPLAFMRGRTLTNSYVILDEAQNTTKNQMKMFLTRMGQSSQYIITGDDTQIDLPKKTESGLLHSIKVLEDVEEIGVVRFDKSDIVRHGLVQKIVEAYEKMD
ncbi:MAG: PhoH family protein [Bacteroidales bacterium]